MRFRPRRRLLVALFLSICLLVLWGERTGAVRGDKGGWKGQKSTLRSYRIDPKRLPRPHATRSVLFTPRLVPRPANAALTAPSGFRVSVFAEGLKHPRWLAVAPNGDVFCVESGLNQSGPNRITVLRDTKRNGHADSRTIFAKGLNLPFGIAFHQGYLYVANTGSVVRWPYHTGQQQAGGPPETVLSGIPERGWNQHWTRNILFPPNGRKLYLTIGSIGNAGVEEERRGAILEYDVSSQGRIGQKYRLFATGLRNPVGLALHPATGQLWTTCNERDFLGDELVPDFVTSIRPGGFYGWPYYYIGTHHDPRLPERPDLRRRTLVPDVLLSAHSAPLGLCFYTANRFPPEYRGNAFVALHGSTNRSRHTGYKIVRIRFDAQGKPRGGYEDFITGWILEETQREVWGRPVGLVEDGRGGLLIADDAGNRIWRVTYEGK